jgi:SAM-dependent methyltransferase
MEFSFPHYLLSKQSVDDRALNRHVYGSLTARLNRRPIRIIEVGAGIGTMPVRLLRWGLITQADYIAVDEMQENIDYAFGWIQQLGAENNLKVEKADKNRLRLFDENRDVQVTFECADVFDFIQMYPLKADLLIAHAFLDLLPMPDSLPKLLTLLKPEALAWLTINFDGVTTLEPVIDPALDSKIEQLYHHSMDIRKTGGDSRSGRHLFEHIRRTGATILAAGPSDWVVHAQDGRYPAAEANFLHCILHFFEQSLSGSPELDTAAFADWLSERRAQIDRGELVYIAHQMDFLVQR